MMYGSELRDMQDMERQKVNVFEMKYLRKIVGMTRKGRIKNEVLH